MLRVLCVDDYGDILFLLETIFDGHFQVDSCLTAEQALEKLERNSFDVVLLDVQLGDSDSASLLQTIRNDPAHRSVPVIAFTAHAMAGDRERFLAMGFDGYISKPILDEQEFVRTIRGFLRIGGERGQP